MLRAKLSLVRSGEVAGDGGTALCHVDLALVKALKPGDELHLARTPLAGLGMSSLRDGQLVFAVGAVTSVPLGEDLSVRIPLALMSEVEGIFRQRDPSFELPWPYPLEIAAGSETLLMPGSQRRLTGYEVRVFGGFFPGEDSGAESVAIARVGLCSSVAANASAQLLAADGLTAG